VLDARSPDPLRYGRLVSPPGGAANPHRLVVNRPGEFGYAGVGVTFGRVSLALAAEGLAGADVVIVGAPFDDGVSFRPGTRFGPRAIRMGEDAGAPPGRPNMELGIDPYQQLEIVDYGDVEVHPADLDASHRSLRTAVSEILDVGAVPVVLGGDHSLSTPVLQALAGPYGADGFSVVHFDTHADAGMSESEPPHGVPFRRAVVEGALDGHNIVQIGLRGSWPFPEEFSWMREAGFRFTAMAANRIVHETLSGIAVRRSGSGPRRESPASP